MLVEIFSWLPPESLIRFKCVSRSWYALINTLMKNTEFVNKHLRNIDKKILSSTCLVFCCPSFGHWYYPELESLRRKLFKSLTIFHDDNYSDHINYVIEQFDLPTLPGNQCAFDNLVGIHCNGIICQADYYGSVILCNPAIKEWRTLPKTFLDDGYCAIGVGFGYDLSVNDYKVVRFGCKKIGHDMVDLGNIKAVVYSMGTDSWRDIGIYLELDIFPIRDNKFFCKGVFYWSMWAQSYTIVSFDMSNEVFHKIPSPRNLHMTDEKIEPTLTVWNESIALFLCHIEGGVSRSIDLWVMDDYSCGVKKGSCRWIKKLIIEPLVDVRTPLTFLKNDEILMVAKDWSLILYNFRRQVFKKHIESIPLRRWDFPYMKSLVSVQNTSQSRS